MEICNGRDTEHPHDEIVHEAMACPVCEMVEKAAEAQKEIDQALADVKAAVRTVEGKLRDKLAEYGVIYPDTTESPDYLKLVRRQPLLSAEFIQETVINVLQSIAIDIKLEMD